MDRNAGSVGDAYGLGFRAQAVCEASSGGRGEMKGAVNRKVGRGGFVWVVCELEGEMEVK